MQKNIFIVVFFLFGILAKAQSVKLEGFVVDESALPLEMANVMVINESTKAMDGYSITNDKGRYLLNLKANTTYLIKVSYIGFVPFEETINTSTENISKNIILKEGLELEGIEIVHEMPVSIKGDTIVYNADSFTTGTERKLEDVLKKLPGVEVNADGEVEVEGKVVHKLMVEGKDFFDGDTKLGVKNIPADAIDKVQILRNYNEIDQMKGLGNDQDNIAMNIKLKEGKKNFWFGDISAGIGVAHKEERYIVNPKLFYYNPTYSINLITNFNNIGELPLTIQDYFKMTGGFRNMMSKGGSRINIASNDLGIMMMRNNRAKEIETRFGAGNFSYNVNKSWRLSGFGILSSSTTEMETISQSKILDQDVEQKSTSSSVVKSTLAMSKLSSSYKPNTSVQLDYDVMFKTSKQDEMTHLDRTVINAGNADEENILTQKNQKPVSVTQNASLYYTINDKNIVTAELQHLYQNEDPFYNADMKTAPFDLSGYNFLQARNNINQERFVQTNKIDTKIDYYYVLTNKSNINFTLGNTYSHQGFNSNIFQVLDNGNVNNLDDTENQNNVRYDFTDTFLGVHYKILTGKFTITPGLNFHQFSMKNEQLGTVSKENFNRILPDLNIIYQIKKSESLTYDFAYTNNFTDINQLAEGYLFSGYHSLFKGNRNLENSTAITHSLRYFKFNMFNQENIFAYINYSKTQDAIKTNAVFDGINQSSTPFNSNFEDQSFTASANYGRSIFRKLKGNVGASVNWMRYNNIRNSEYIAVESLLQNYTGKLSTNFRSFPNLEFGYTFSVNDYADNQFYTHKPFASLDYYFLDGFSFKTDYEFYNYSNKEKTVKNQYDFLSASFAYQKKGGKWEYRISGTNLLNTRSLNNDSFTQFVTNTSQYRVQPRYVILSLKYNI